MLAKVEQSKFRCLMRYHCCIKRGARSKRDTKAEPKPTTKTKRQGNAIEVDSSNISPNADAPTEVHDTSNSKHTTLCPSCRQAMAAKTLT